MATNKSRTQEILSKIKSIEDSGIKSHKLHEETFSSANTYSSTPQNLRGKTFDLAMGSLLVSLLTDIRNELQLIRKFSR